MIFYFTATGNSLSIAKEVAKSLGDELVSIPEVIKSNQYSFKFKEKEKIGFIFPCYFYGIPPIIEEFVNHLDHNEFTNHYVYSIVDYGDAIGSALSDTCNLFSKNKINISSAFDVFMPNNYVVMYKAPTKERAEEILSEAYRDLGNIIESIQREEKNDHLKMKDKLNKVISIPVHAFYNYHRKRNKFYVEESCVGCGLCEKNCPQKVIHMQNGKPTWSGDCIECLSCLNRCPKSAIQFGKSTKKNGRYVHPDFVLND